MSDNETIDVGEQTNIPQTAEATPEVETAEATTPQVESKDGKVYVDGKRVYTRDELNYISANSAKEYESKLLTRLDVDSMDQVEELITTLRSTTSTGEEPSLNVKQLQDVVMKKTQTVEELQSQLQNLQKEMVMKEHMNNLYSAMPSSWTTQQKDSVVKLMDANNMFVVENNEFAIRNGEEFLTADGMKPDYESAVRIVGVETLGLPTTKRGVEVPSMEKNVKAETTTKPLDETMLKSNREYNSAYTELRTAGNARSQISHKMVMDKMASRKANYIPSPGLQGAAVLKKT